MKHVKGPDDIVCKYLTAWRRNLTGQQGHGNEEGGLWSMPMELAEHGATVFTLTSNVASIARPGGRNEEYWWAEVTDSVWRTSFLMRTLFEMYTRSREEREWGRSMSYGSWDWDWDWWDTKAWGKESVNVGVYCFSSHWWDGMLTVGYWNGKKVGSIEPCKLLIEWRSELGSRKRRLWKCFRSDSGSSVRLGMSRRATRF